MSLTGLNLEDGRDNRGGANVHGVESYSGNEEYRGRPAEYDVGMALSLSWSCQENFVGEDEREDLTSGRSTSTRRSSEQQKKSKGSRTEENSPNL